MPKQIPLSPEDRHRLLSERAKAAPRDIFGRFITFKMNTKDLQEAKKTDTKKQLTNQSVLDQLKLLLKRKNRPISTGDAMRWYRGIVKELTTPPVQATLMDDSKRMKTDVGPKMYMFVYDPKWKKTLPYYDTFPLVIPIGEYDDGFLGLNLHYLSPQERYYLFLKLLSFATDTKLDDQTRLRVTYEFLKGVAKYKEATPCIKRYLSGHVRSRFLELEAPFWEIVLFMPVENFQKASKTKVWSESRAKMVKKSK